MSVTERPTQKSKSPREKRKGQREDEGNHEQGQACFPLSPISLI